MRQFFWVTACLMLLAGCRGTAASKSVFIDPALLSLVPPDARVLVGANLESLRKSQIYQEHFANQFAAQLDGFKQQTGLDPRKDIWEILAFSSQASTVVLARGKFSVADLEPKLDQQGAQKTKFKGYTVYGDDKNAAVFLNSSTAAASDGAALREMLERRDKASAPPETLLALTREIPHGIQLWAAFEGNFIRLPVEDGSNLGNVNRILGGLQSGMAYVNMSNGLDVKAQGTGSSEESARSIHDALRALLGILRLNTKTEQKELLDIYDAVDIKQSERNVQLAAHIKQDLVEQLLKSAILNGGRPTFSPESRRPNSTSPRPH